MLSRWFSIAGRATALGTQSFSGKNPKIPSSCWRETTTGLTLSSVGIGTYIGAPDDETDKQVTEAIYNSVSTGSINHIDTAINYRYQKAERSVGRALVKLIEDDIKREEFFVSSKIGYIPEDADKGIPGKTIVKNLVSQGLISEDDIAGGVHCMHPEYLKDQLQRSLENIGIDTLDLLYLHNVAESQLPLVKEEKFWQRLEKAFEFLENARKNGKIVNYGMATWICFRSPATEKDLHVSLEKVVELAEKVGGKDHGFKYIQVPINVMMPEAFVHTWQKLKDNNGILLNVAKELGVNVVGSSPLLQGKVIDIKLSKTMLGIDIQACKHLQLIRSIPSSALKSVLVGMKNPRNVAQNLKIQTVGSLTSDEFWDVITPEGKDPKSLVIDLW